MFLFPALSLTNISFPMWRKLWKGDRFPHLFREKDFFFFSLHLLGFYSVTNVPHSSPSCERAVICADWSSQMYLLFLLILRWECLALVIERCYFAAVISSLSVKKKQPEQRILNRSYRSLNLIGLIGCDFFSAQTSSINSAYDRRLNLFHYFVCHLRNYLLQGIKYLTAI